MQLTTWNKQQTTEQRHSVAPTRKSNKKCKQSRNQKSNIRIHKIEITTDASNWKTCQKLHFQYKVNTKCFKKSLQGLKNSTFNSRKEVHLELSRTSTMKLFFENISQLKVVNHFRKKSSIRDLRLRFKCVSAISTLIFRRKLP